MALATFSKNCCGVAELSGFGWHGDHSDGDIKAHLITLAKQRMKVTFHVMTCTNVHDFGKPLKEYVEKNGLGEVTETPDWHLNQFHGPKKLKVYVWRVEKKGWEKFCEENLTAEDKKKAFATFGGVAPY